MFAILPVTVSLPVPSVQHPDKPENQTFRFGPFQFETQSGTLRRSGIPIRLADQPAKLLTELLGNAGRVVTREELRTLLWSSETFVQFDGALNSAIRKLRQALNDDAESPRFLETIPKRGYRFIAPVEVLEELGSAPATPQEAEPETPAPVESSTDSSRPRFGLLGVAVTLVSALLWWFVRSGTLTTQVVRYTIPLAAGQTVAWAGGRSVAISADGKRIAYRVNQNQWTSIFVSKVNSPEPEKIFNMPADEISFGPDNETIYLMYEGELAAINPNGTKTTQLKYPITRGWVSSTWGRGNEFFFSRLPAANSTSPADVHRWVPGTQNSETIPIKREPGKEEGLLPQQIEPSGRALIYSTLSSPHDRSVFAFDFATRNSVLLAHPGQGGYITPSGIFVYSWAGNLLAAPIDTNTWTLKTAPVTVLRGLAVAGWRGPQMALSSNGTLVYVPQPSTNDRRMVWVDMNGKEALLPIPPSSYLPLDVSPDGQRLLLSRKEVDDQSWTIWMLDLRNGDSRALTGKVYTEPAALWSPDGARVVFSYAENPDQLVNLYLKSPVLEGVPRRLTVSKLGQFPQAWSASGDRLWMVEGYAPSTGVDITTVPIANPSVETQVVKSPYMDTHPAVSPDGRWLTYVGYAKGQRILIRPVDEPSPLLEVPDLTAFSPIWAKDGRSLFVRSGRKFLRIGFEPGPPPRIGKIETLFEGDYVQPTQWFRNTILHPDGKHFLLTKEENPAPESTRVEVVINWFSELEAKVPRRP